MCKIFFLTVALAGLSLAGNRLWAGEIQGQIHAPVSKFQKDVVVYVDAIQGKTFQPPEKHVVVDQKNLSFNPHVLPLLVGITVDFLNSDAVLHNVFSPDAVADKFNLGTWPKGQTRSHTFQKVGSAAVLCNVHPEMEAFIVILPTPYFAKTDEQGNFKIEGVPAGTYTLKVWHEKNWKAAPQKVSVAEKGAVTVEFKVSR